MDKLTITAALTGAQQGKDMNPNLPEHPQEIIWQAPERRQAGAAVFHIHARDPEGRPKANTGIL